MSEIISKWILHQIGLVVNTTSSPVFAQQTANGYILAKILHSYDIITNEELNLINEEPVTTEDHYKNFKLISQWLLPLKIDLKEEDIYEIVHQFESACLHLFYQVFLELKDRTRLDFLTEKEINMQLGRQLDRFNVTKVQQRDESIDLQREGLCEPFLKGGYAFNWYKDRMEVLQSKCRDARDEYINNNFKRKKQMSKFIPTLERAPLVASRMISSKGQSFSLSEPEYIETIPNEEVSTYDMRTYDELIKEQEKVRDMLPITPDPSEAKKIIKNLQNKNKIHRENLIFRNQLNQEIMSSFEKKLSISREEMEDRNFALTFMKQSQYEKELVTKVAQVTMHKDYMTEKKINHQEMLEKLKEKQFVDALFAKDNEIDDKKLSYYLEEERVLNLHRKLWNEKQKRKAAERETLCIDVVQDMVEMAMKVAELQTTYCRPLDRREMQDLKNICVSGKPIESIHEPIIDVILQNDEEIEEEEIDEETSDFGKVENIEPLIQKEMDRQNAIDEIEFENYMHYEYPWEFLRGSNSSHIIDQISSGLNILGFIVHCAFDAKYPNLPLWEKPEFPTATVRACVNHLEDTSVLLLLRKLLMKRGVEVIEMQQVVDVCIEVYILESITEVPDTPEEKAPKEHDKRKRNDKKKEKAPKKGKGIKKAIASAEQKTPEVETDDKRVQTPLRFPCEEIPYSTLGVLGRTMKELMDDGEKIPDFLLIHMFVEYLKTIPNLNGWVLINFPTTFQQAVLLEEALTGKKFFHKEDVSNCSIQGDVKATEVYSTSLILPNPIPREPIKMYDTILTAYIKIMKTENVKSDDPNLPPCYEALNAETADPLDKFYSEAGANYCMYCKDFDIATVKYLAKLIIGDFTLPLKGSVELFGEYNNTTNSVDNRSVKSTKVGKQAKRPGFKVDPATTKSEKSTIVTDKKGKRVKAVIEFQETGVQVPSDADEDSVQELSSTAESQLMVDMPKPGQIGWQFSQVVCPEEILVGLANIWETEENVYTSDMKQLFFLRRLNTNAIMPFINFVKESMKKVIERPDYKCFYLEKFQRAFNNFNEDFRKDDEFKAEMHWRIEDFKEKLTEMCDLKMMDTESERCRIIDQSWAPRQFTTLLNNYVGMLEVELDRFLQSMHIINDFFLGSTGAQPIDVNEYKEDSLTRITNIQTKAINEMFEDHSKSVDLSHFKSMFDNVVNKVQNIVKRVTAMSTSLCEKGKVADSPKGKHKGKDGKSTDRDERTTIKNQKLFEEWQTAIDGENYRVLVRVDLIERNAMNVVQDCLGYTLDSFHEIYQDIKSRYDEELRNVEIACNFFKMAVENEVPLSKQLVFDDDNIFRINPEVLTQDLPPIKVVLTSEEVEDGAFTISELSQLANILLDLCPKGFMPKATFISIIQEVCANWSPWKAPKLWKTLKSTDLKRVVNAMYDDTEYVYWRDFIVYNMRIPYPTEAELLITRNAFREWDTDLSEFVHNYQFYSIKAWFETTYDYNHSMDIKGLLYKIYSVKDLGMQYTMMLLDFCKDDNAIEGFAKALELSMGKIICWDIELGNVFTKEYSSRMTLYEQANKKREQERGVIYKAVYEEVVKLVDYAVQITDEVWIEDLNPPQDKPKMGNPPISIAEDASQSQQTITSSSSGCGRLFKDLPDNVGTEMADHTEVYFFINLDVVITIIMAALPWHSKVNNYGEPTYFEKAAAIFEKYQDPDFNMFVLSHHFLNSVEFTELLGQTKKFNIIDPVVVLHEILAESK